MILFTCATSHELQIVKSEIKKLKKCSEVEYLVSWMGNYETIFNLERFLSLRKPDFIVNIWVCGYKNEKFDLIQIWRVVNLAIGREVLLPIVFEFTKIESIASSEKIIYDLLEIWEENFVDMESFWIEFMANKYKIPRLIFKVPVDKIWEETKKFDYKKALELLWSNIDYKELIEKIEEFLLKNKPKKDYEFIKNHFKLTFSEFENLKKDIMKYETIFKKDFLEFFDENKEIGKREFLEKIKFYL